jgi:hypothetical protein
MHHKIFFEKIAFKRVINMFKYTRIKKIGREYGFINYKTSIKFIENL